MLATVGAGLGLALAAVSPSHAGDYCWNEKITQLILTGDDIFFTSEKSCLSWCRVNPAWSADAKNRAYATLLTARSTDRRVGFYFDSATVSCAAQVVSAWPSQILLTD